MFGVVGRSQAYQDIRIDDRAPAGPIVATVNNVAVPLLGDSTNDFIHFVYQAENNTPSPLSLSLSKDLLDPLTFALSDRLLVTLTLGSSSVDVRFDSRLPVLLGKGQNDQGAVVENDLFQPMFGYDWGTAAGTFFAASEPHPPIPEPATTWLMLSGLAGIAGIASRRRGRA